LQVKKEETLLKEGFDAPASDYPFGATSPGKPSLDLAFKEGQTIRVNLNIDRKKDRPVARSGGLAVGAGPLLLPPPPGAVPASTPAVRPAPSVISPVSSNFDLLGGLDSSVPVGSSGTSSSTLTPVDNGDPWGDFTSAPSSTTLKSGSWEQF